MPCQQIKKHFTPLKNDGKIAYMGDVRSELPSEIIEGWGVFHEKNTVVVQQGQAVMVELERRDEAGNETTESQVYWISQKPSDGESTDAPPVPVTGRCVLSGDPSNLMIDTVVQCSDPRHYALPELAISSDLLRRDLTIVLSRSPLPNQSDQTDRHNHEVHYKKIKQLHARLMGPGEVTLAKASQWLQFHAKDEAELIPSLLPQSFFFTLGQKRFTVSPTADGEYQVGSDKGQIHTLGWLTKELLLSDEHGNSSVRLIYLDPMNGLLIGGVRGEVRIEAA